MLLTIPCAFLRQVELCSLWGAVECQTQVESNGRLGSTSSRAGSLVPLLLRPRKARARTAVNSTMVVDYGTIRAEVMKLEEIAISKFKATCLAVLERVRKTREPILVTRFRKPVAQILPPPAPPRQQGWLGSLSSTGEITGDIVVAACDESDWEVLRS